MRPRARSPSSGSDLAAHHVEAGLERDLGDAGAHGAQTDDADRANFHVLDPMEGGAPPARPEHMPRSFVILAALALLLLALAGAVVDLTRGRRPALIGG